MRWKLTQTIYPPTPDLPHYLLLLTVLPRLFCAWSSYKLVCCLSINHIFILSSIDVTNRGDETTNTVMKELFSWHSTLKPEDAFPRT